MPPTWHALATADTPSTLLRTLPLVPDHDKPRLMRNIGST